MTSTIKRGGIMPDITITEALAEIAIIDKRLEKKRQDVLPYVARLDMVRDPFEREGGSAEFIAQQRQSFTDLLQRKIRLRAAIAKANAETFLPGLEGMSVADWLVWKREGYEVQHAMLSGLLAKVRSARMEAQRQGTSLLAGPVESARPNDIIVNINERELVEELEALEEMHGKLDGLLSLKNATTVITVD
jgi:hypothetical protein